MNSIDRHLTAKTLMSLAKLLRSKGNDIYFFVEGNDDINLFSVTLGLKKSHFIDCKGKNFMMEIYSAIPLNGIDDGFVFIRDADFDGLGHSDNEGVKLFVSDGYDFEFTLLEQRLFSRIISDFLNLRATHALIDGGWQKLTRACSYLGALKKISHDNNFNLKFDELEFKFIDKATLSVDAKRMVSTVFQRSENFNAIGVDQAIDEVNNILNSHDYFYLCSGKDILKLLYDSLSRYFGCKRQCAHSEETLARMLRIAANQDDLRKMSFYPLLAKHIASAGFAWHGSPL